MVWPCNEEISIYHPSQQKSDALLQDDRIMTLKVIQRTPLPPQAEGERDRRQRGVKRWGHFSSSGGLRCPCPVPQGWDPHRGLQHRLCLVEPWGWGHSEEPWARDPHLEESCRYGALAEDHSGDAALGRVTAVGQSYQVMEVTMPPQWALKAEHQVKDYF